MTHQVGGSGETHDSPAPLITIGITCYREGDLLRECWESVLAQTDDRWVAVVVVDGGADEETRKVFASIEHPKLVKKFAFEENVGPYPVRNKAFELTETPYHFYLDSDDMLPPGCIAAMYRTLEEHPDAALVYGDFVELPHRRQVCLPKTFRRPEDIVSALGANLYSVEMWRAVGGFSDVLARGGGDLDFRISLWEAGAPMYHCGGIYYLYRRGREQSVSASRLRSRVPGSLSILRRHPSFFRDRAAKEQFLAYNFRIAIGASLVSGDRTAVLKYSLLAAWHLGVQRTEYRQWLLRALLGEKWYGRLQYHIMRRL
jgi:glycosyltransferase involved in cell wall biosynthesis